MRSRLAIAVTAGLGLAGCASPMPSRQISPNDMSWVFYETREEGAKLAYGVPDSDNVPVMFVCSPGSRRVSIAVPVGEKHRGRVVKLISEGTASQLKATFSNDEDWAELEASTPSDDPVLRHFAESGRLIVDDGEYALLAPATDKRPIQAFLKRCSG